MLFYTVNALIGYLFGVYILSNQGISYELPVMFTIVFVLLLSLIKNTRKLAVSVLVVFIFATIGVFNMQRHNHTSGYTDEFVTVWGRISEIPYKSNDVWCYTLNCDDIEYIENKAEFSERISFYSEAEYKLDDYIKAEGFLKLHSGAKNPGGFDSYTYYKSMGINYKMTSYKDELVTADIKPKTIYSCVVRLKNKACEFIDENFSADDSAVLKCILTGFKKDMERDYNIRLQNSGVLRSLYAPYFHLILIMSFIGYVFKRVPVKLKSLIICICCILYIAVNPYSLTARKLFLFTVALEAMKNISKMYRPIDVFCGVVLVCGLQNPFILYNEGFIMSCAASIFIIVFYNRIYRKIQSVNRYKTFARIVAMIFVSIVLITPVAAFLFDGISVYSFLTSIVLFPVIAAVYILSPLMFAGGFVSEIALYIIRSFVIYIRNFPVIVESLPFYYVVCFKPGITLLLGYVFALWAWSEKKRKATFKVLISIALGLFMSFFTSEMYRAGKAELRFLQAGQGDCSFFDVPYKCTVMIDGGGNAEYMSNSDVGNKDILPYLRYEGIHSVDYIFVSHYHQDHCEGIMAVMDKARVKKIFLPDCMIENEFRVMIESKAKAQNIDIYYIRKPETINLDGGVSCEILHFDKNAEEENDKSVIMRLSYDEFSCLYMGDATMETEKLLINNGVDLRADVLKVGHHGSKTSSSAEFLEKVNPGLAVAMHNEGNIYGFPSEEVIDNMRITETEFVTTAEGSVEVKERDGQIKWQRKTH